MTRTVADQLVSALIEAGVQRIYGIVGDSLNPVVDAVRRSGGSANSGLSATLGMLAMLPVVVAVAGCAMVSR